MHAAMTCWALLGAMAVIFTTQVSDFGPHPPPRLP